MTDTKPEVKRHFGHLPAAHQTADWVAASDYDALSAKVQALEGERDSWRGEYGRTWDWLQATRRDLEAARGERDASYERALEVCAYWKQAYSGTDGDGDYIAVGAIERIMHDITKAKSQPTPQAGEHAKCAECGRGIQIIQGEQTHEPFQCQPHTITYFCSAECADAARKRAPQAGEDV